MSDSNQAVQTLWQNKREMDPRKLKTIQERNQIRMKGGNNEMRSHLDF